VVATGAAEISRRAVGTAVFGGMLAATSIGIFLVPMLYVTFQRWREDAKQRFGRSKGERLLMNRVATRRRHFLSRGCDYFFFFEVFFATFLVAAFAVFAFFAFLAMSSSTKISLSEHGHAVHRHAQHRDDITIAKLIPTRREAALESRAGSSQSRRGGAG
jgi:hypothetical protein